MRIGYSILISVLIIISASCEQKSTETAKDQKIKPDQYTDFELIDSVVQNKMYGFLGAYEFHDSLTGSDSSVTNVDIIHLVPYIDDENKEYNDIKLYPKDKQFEAIIYQDTLYLKFFKRTHDSESGVQVKVTGQKFTTAPYTSIGGWYHPEIKVKPLGVIVSDIDSSFYVNRQILYLNKRTYKIGDKISGKIFYEGRANFGAAVPVMASVFLKGSFQGIVKEGQPFSRTAPKGD